MLGRCRRRVLVCDERRPRNRHSRALHGFLTRDGMAPGELNHLGRLELQRYGVEVRTVTVNTVTRHEGSFDVRLADGTQERARFILLATGVVDDLPDVAGLADCYGTSVFHCPYCDGWEQRDQPIAVFGRGRSGVQLALSLKTWSPEVTLCTHGTAPATKERARLASNDVECITAAITQVVHEDGQIKRLEFREREPLAARALFFTTAQHPRCGLATQLGCRFNRKGTVETSLLGETNVPGIYVAGDASHDAQFVIVAAAEGAKAALAINQALQRTELRP